MINENKRVESWISEEERRCKDLHYRLARKYGRISKDKAEGHSRLGYREKKGIRYYSEVWIENGRRISRYLGTDENPEVRSILELRFLEKALEMLDERLNALSECEHILKSFSLGNVNATLPKVYRLSPDIMAEIIGADEEEQWYQEAKKEKERFERKSGEWYPEGKRHKAKDGTKVRSKSEMTIANELIDRGIKYLYEMPVKLRNIWIHPDFMFYSFSRAKPVFWEHIGMTDDERYMDKFNVRVDTYVRAGLTPCVDVLFTFDTSSGEINLETIDKLIEEYR